MVAPAATKIPPFLPQSGEPAHGVRKRLTLGSYAATLEPTAAPIAPMVDTAAEMPSLGLRVAALIGVALMTGLLMSRAAALPPQSEPTHWMQTWVLPSR